MRPLKFALTGLLLALAVVGGLFTVVLVALTTIAVFLFERLGHHTALSQPPEGRHDNAAPRDNVTDVTATEIDSER